MPLSQADADLLFDRLSAFHDGLPEGRKEAGLARLVLILAHRLGDRAAVEAAIADAEHAGPGAPAATGDAP